METRARARSLAEKGVPWRRGIAWPVVAIEGVIVLGIGIYLLVASDARDVVRQLIGAVLLVNSLLHIAEGFRNPAQTSTPLQMLRGGIGLTVGLIVVLEPISDYLDADASRFILALGLLGFGLIGLAVIVVTREESGLRMGALISAALTIVLAIVLFTGSESGEGRTRLLGAIAVAAGVLLLAYATYLFRSARADGVATSAGQV